MTKTGLPWELMMETPAENFNGKSEEEFIVVLLVNRRQLGFLLLRSGLSRM